MAKYGDRFDYSKIPENFNSREKVTIICKQHGEFKILIGNHLKKDGGCRVGCCNKRRKTSDQFIEQAKRRHGDKYDYSKTNYTTNHDKVIIICKIHGEFLQEAKQHLYGSNCPKCAPNPKVDTKDFIERAAKVHNGKFDYSLVNYQGTDINVDIICPTHGVFKQRPHRHLQGDGCKKCSNHISKVEKEWLDGLSIPHLKRQFKLKIGKRSFFVDGFDEKTNTVYEFYGDFYHGNSKYYDWLDVNAHNGISFYKLFQNTKERENIIKEAGYNLITIWQSEYLESKGKKFRKMLDPQKKWVRRYHLMRYYETLEGDEPINDYSYILDMP